MEHTPQSSSPRESTDSSIITVSRYTSRFREHMSQAFTDYPPDWPFPIPTSQQEQLQAPPPHGVAKSQHKQKKSIESFASMMSKAPSSSSGSSTSSLSKLKRAVRKMKSSIFVESNSVSYAETTPPGSPGDQYTMKGSKRTFRKEDIRMAGLTHSTNMSHYV